MRGSKRRKKRKRNAERNGTTGERGGVMIDRRQFVFKSPRGDQPNRDD